MHSWVLEGGSCFQLRGGGGGGGGEGGGGWAGGVGGLPGKENWCGLMMHLGVFCELKSPVCKRYYQQHFIQNVRYANTLILPQQINS